MGRNLLQRTLEDQINNLLSVIKINFLKLLKKFLTFLGYFFKVYFSIKNYLPVIFYFLQHENKLFSAATNKKNISDFSGD